MSTMPPEIPARVFTAYKMPRFYGTRHYGFSDSDPWVGLIFVARNAILGVPDLEQVMWDPVIRRVMGDFYMGGPFRWSPRRSSYSWRESIPFDHYDATGTHNGLLIAQQPVLLPDCRRNPNTPFYIVTQKRMYRQTVYDMYCNCRDLYRLMGCDRCPAVGETCLYRHLRLLLPQSSLPGFGDDCLDMTSDAFQNSLLRQQLRWGDVKDTFKSGKSKVAGYTYISPVLASLNPTCPRCSIDVPYALDFESLEDAQAKLRGRAIISAETRRTKRVECTKCYFGGTGYGNTPAPCDKYRPRSCRHGAWTEAQIVQATVPPFERHLRLSGLSMRDFYCVLAVAGKPFRQPTENGGYAKWIVSRVILATTPSGILLKRISRTHRNTSEIVGLSELLRILPDDLRRIFDETPKLSPEMTATAIQLSVCNTVRPYTCMAGCVREVAPDISHVCAVGTTCIEVGYWLTTYWRTMRFSGLESVANYFQGLPAFNISNEEEDLAFQWRVWPRH